MRIVRIVFAMVLVVVAGWLAAQSVSVQAAPGKVQITIDREKLGDASRELSAKGRRAVAELARALKSASGKLDESAEQPKS